MNFIFCKRIGRGSFRSGMRMDDEGDDFDMQSGKERTYRRATNSDIDWIYQTKYYQGEQEDVVRDLDDSLSNDEQKRIHKIFLRYIPSSTNLLTRLRWR